MPPPGSRTSRPPFSFSRTRERAGETPAFPGLRGELDLKPCSLRVVVVDGDAAIVVVDDAVDDGQAEAGAAAFGGKVWEEEFLLVGVGDAAAGIGNLDHDAVRRAAGGDAHFAAFGRL